jgi:hypothetical protein
MKVSFLLYFPKYVTDLCNGIDINITEGRERLDYDYLEPLGRLIVQAKNSKILSK